MTTLTTALLSQSGLPDLAAVLNQVDPLHAGSSTVPKISLATVHHDIPIYYPPAGTRPGAIRAIWTALTLCGRSDDARPKAWQTFVLSMAVVAFPDLLPVFRQDVRNVDFVLTPYSEAFVSDCSRAIVHHSTQRAETDKCYVNFPAGLPEASTIEHTSQLATSAEQEILFAYYSMVVFILAKTVDKDNEIALTQNRPMAIIRKMNLTSDNYLLMGEGKVPPRNYGNVRSGWIRSDNPRVLIIRYLAILVGTEAKSNIYAGLVMNMQLMKNANQTYIYHIYSVLRACPWALEIPSVVGAFSEYVKMVKKIHEQPDWFRPYYKLAYQDMAHDVKRRGLEPLIAIATTFQAQTNPSMNKYRIPRGCAHVIEQFIKVAAKHNVEIRAVEDQQTAEVTLAI